MIPKRQIRLTTVLIATVVLATSACSSGTTGEPTASSGSASVANSPAFPSESLAPGVQKDSVLDLNSTKDMTGVVTTVPINKSPYIDHFPDICALIPESATRELGVTTKQRGFRGTQLISQACSMLRVDGGEIPYSVTVNFYINNLKEISDPGIADTLQTGVRISDKVTANVNKLRRSGPDDVTYQQECGTAWGTFFGAIVVRFRTETPDKDAPCPRAIEAARAIAPYMPKSPSEMRPAP